MTILVLGAGMAGLKAAYDLHAAGQEVIVLEARDRIGGRVWTDREFAGFPLELGGEWIHGDRVPTWDLVRGLGLTTRHWPKQHESGVRLEDGSWKTMHQARQDHPDFDLTRSWDLPEIPVLPDDEPFADYLRRIGFNEDQINYTRRSFSNALCEAPEDISAVAALADMGHEECGEGDFRILEGYDRLTHHLAEGLDIRLNTVIREIEWGGAGVRVTTDTGVVFEASQAVIALPLGVLQSGGIVFSPALPESKQTALKHLRMGVALKMVYLFAEPITPPELEAIYSRLNPPMWWLSSVGRSAFPGRMWSAFATGNWARELLAKGEEGALATGLETLRTELNLPEIQPVAQKLVNWRDDPYALGGYSVALVGGAGAREALAAPVDDKLFFAGEATAPNHHAATIHGAYMTGARAAQEISPS